MVVGRTVRGRARLRALSAAALATVLVGCSASADRSAAPGSSSPSPSGSASENAAPPGDRASADPESQARFELELPRGRVPVDTLVEVAVSGGTLEKIGLKPVRGGVVPGTQAQDGSGWTAEERLEPGTTYRLTGTAVDADGVRTELRRTFRTEDLTLDQQTFASIAPLEGETVGVGMPVVVAFDVAVTDRAEIEEHLAVTARPAQRGSWHWISDNEVHWRPRSYWKPGTDVTVTADVNGVDAGDGIFGQEDREVTFRVGDALVMQIDVPRHTMQVRRNGELLRTIPVSAGKAGFATRSGVKVIMEKFRQKRMDAATTGIRPGDPEYYNIANVEYAQRVTYSGEFLHAAPWSVGSQGSANVSHGCVGMSTADAAWLYSLTKRGDVVDVTGTGRSMELANGYGDWNLSWEQYRAGSALAS
jgi:lipoprotein-anchoring transpeptidase ErfK/SrfK